MLIAARKRRGTNNQGGPMQVISIQPIGVPRESFGLPPRCSCTGNGATGTVAPVPLAPRLPKLPKLGEPTKSTLPRVTLRHNPNPFASPAAPAPKQQQQQQPTPPAPTPTPTPKPTPDPTPTPEPTPTPDPKPTPPKPGPVKPHFVFPTHVPTHPPHTDPLQGRK